MNDYKDGPLKSAIMTAAVFICVVVGMVIYFVN